MPRVAANATVEDGGGLTVDSLTVAQRKTFEGFRKPVERLSNEFGKLRESLKDYAQPIIKFFRQLQAENTSFTFVEYVRWFNKDLATHAEDRPGAEGYRNDKTYYTLDYMRRMVTTRVRGKRGVRDTATDALARTIATILQVTPDANSVWTAVQKEFKFTERMMGLLRKRVDRTSPLFQIEVHGRVRVGNVIQMQSTRVEGAEAPAGEPMAQRGRRIVKRAGRKRAA